MKISQFIVKEANVIVNFLGLEGVSLTLKKLSSKELLSIRDKCISGKKFDKKLKQYVDEINNKKFLKMYSDAVIVDWKGLKGKHLKKLLLINLPKDMEETNVDCSSENKEELLINCSDLDDYITEVLGDVALFNEQQKDSELKK